MSEVIQLAPPFRETPGAQLLRRDASAIRTDAVYVVFTTIDETLAAVRVADILGKVMTVPLTLIHFRAVPYPLSVDAPAGLSPVETDAFVGRLQAESFDVRVRVFVPRRAPGDSDGVQTAFLDRDRRATELVADP